MLKNLNYKVHYDSEEDYLISDFYEPVLSASDLYKRGTAYFSSSALTKLLNGIKPFVRNGGKIQMIISPEISLKDQEAIELGLKTKEKVVEETILESFDIEEDEEIEKYNLLAWLVYKDILQIKVVVKNNYRHGIFHEKLGLVYDKNKDCIVFHGTNNETGSALDLNYESFDVFVSWNERDYERIRLKERQFDKLWEGQALKWETYEISEAIRLKLLSYKEHDEPEWFKSNSHDSLDIPIRKIITPSEYEIRKYQLNAINKWFENDGVGIFEMATGSGKTITALIAISKLINLYISKTIPIVLIVVLPYKVLLEQWNEEMMKFGYNNVLCYENSNRWKESLDVNLQYLNNSAISYLSILTTNTTFKTQKFQNYLSTLNCTKILCIDEIHNFLSKRSLDSLAENIDFRLGLSATLLNEYKIEQLVKLKSYFGKGVIFEFTMEEAIRAGFLTKYKYYPVYVDLTDEEKQCYYEISIKIRKMLAFSDIEDDNIQSLFAERARIISSASNKLRELEKMKERVQGTSYNIFYCGDKIEEDVKFIQKVNSVVSNALHLKTHMFTSAEKPSVRKEILEDFKNGHIEALTAIRCLDEGVDIPKLRTAFILSSGSNPKEFIQRRGRVLRKSKGKEYAVIYDFIVVPTLDRQELNILDQEMLKFEKMILFKEISRFKEFAKLSMNFEETYPEMFNILEMYR